MKKFLSVAIITLFVFGYSEAQMLNPVKWNYTATRISDKMYEIHLTATLDPKWHIYAQEAGEGPEPTSFIFSPNPLVKLDGKVKEVGKQEKVYDANFNSTLKFYGGKVDFVQKVKLKSTAATVVKGKINYMVCDDKKCLPPKEVPFSVKLSGK
ncbi:MAG: protein-disulfide reductase DsbD domain-containing protein [Ferruginibacter sp.]